jgi:hypothetical protein
VDSQDPVAVAAVHAIRTGEAGADPNADTGGDRAETPLHWTAALGIMPCVEELLAASPAPSADDITEAFWQACHGGQRRTAERLLASGADPDATPGYSDQTAAQAAAEPGNQRENVISWLRDRAGDRLRQRWRHRPVRRVVL